MANKEYLKNKLNWIEEDINTINTNIKNLENELRLLVVDKNFSLEERWDIFSKFCIEFHKGLIVQKVEFPFLDFQDYINESNFEWLEEIEIECVIYDYKQDRKELEELDEVVNTVKEFCLENFIYSYYNQ